MKLGIIGAGKIVNDFLPAAHLVPGLQLDCICSTERDLPVMQELSRKYGIAAVTTSYDQLLSRRPDLVYVAIPNSLHYSICRMVLESDLNVLVEKPMVARDSEAQELFTLAEKRRVMIFEAITTQYLTNYELLRQSLAQLGDIRLVKMDYSQYSSRYDSFRQGIVFPAFDPEKEGGALMDLNIYNLHFVIGLFGPPEEYCYYPNIVHGIDVSGVMVLHYGSFTATLTAAKDSCSPNISVIQGDKGYLTLNTPSNICGSFDLVLNGQDPRHFDANPFKHRMVEEFAVISDILSSNDTIRYNATKRHSLLVIETQMNARLNAGIIFPRDLK